MQLFDAKVDKELIQEWTGISRQLGSSSQKNHSGTDGACVRRPWNVGKYQNGTSYTRVSARHYSDGRAPLWVSFSKGFWAKNVLSPSGFSTFCGSWEQFLELSMASVSLPFS